MSWFMEEVAVRNIKVAIIDSGLYPHPALTGYCIGGIALKKNEAGEVVSFPDYMDTLGHGTAVADALIKNAGEGTEIYCIRICFDEMETDIACMIKALEIVGSYEPSFDMAVISSGITCPDQYDALREKIGELERKGILIFSAFDNEGAISWPAAFHNVVGTAVYESRTMPVRVIRHNEVNLYLPLQYYRLKWVNPASIIISGSSFANAVVAGKCARWMRENAVKADMEGVLAFLAQELGAELEEGHAYAPESWSRGTEFVGKIKKTIVFPWNKEMHALARFSDMLSFSIHGFYDMKYNFNIGKSVGEAIQNEKDERIVQNIDLLDWNDDFDTVICGHCEEIYQMTKRDFRMEIVEKCKKHGKRLYVLDKEVESKRTENIDCYVPQILETDYNGYRDGKLFQRLTPVVGVFGTSACQGKLTLQMQLKKEFVKMGYTVENVFSEPTGYLLGGIGVFPYGYNANVQLSETESITVLNEMVWEAARHNESDLVIVGGQSGTVPYAYHNIRQFNPYGYSFLTATNPDVFVLCVNLHDPIEYIKRTIKYLEAFDDSPVIALALYPVVTEAATQIGLGYHKRMASERELEEASERLSKEFGIPVYALNQEKEVERLCGDIVVYFSE